MLILSSIFSGLEHWSVNNTLIYENSELRVFKNINEALVYLEFSWWNKVHNLV